MRFHFIASTGRTATTFLAKALDGMDGVAACHEGYCAADKDAEPALPLINLDNRRAFDSDASAHDVVAQKRSSDIIAEAGAQLNADVLIDVAYYNSTIAAALLAAHPEARMVGIIRELEPFIRSATAMEGEDPLPVGWADPAKPLTAREKFIAYGRIRPSADTPEGEAWGGWSAIMRNIWLWRETNQLLRHAAEQYPGRVLLLEFEALKADSTAFLADITGHFGLPFSEADALLRSASEHRNRKPAGYQVGPLSDWSREEQQFAQQARATIGVKQWA